MNVVMITGKLESKIVKDKMTILKVRVVDENLRTSYLLRCVAYGTVETYCENELQLNDEVMITGRLVGKAIPTDGGFSYYTEIKIRYISRLDQMGYGRYE